MALVGNLKDLKLANIIQINCIERNKAKVSIQAADLTGAIFFSDGAIVHADFGPFVGERAVHEMLALNEGGFKVEAGLDAPGKSITQPWNSVVLEGLRLIDEKKVVATPIPRQLFGMLSGMKGVENLYVLNYNGQVLEGRANENMHPLSITFVWYKLKKMLNLFYADDFAFISLRSPQGYVFVFEFRPNLVVIEASVRTLVPEFTFMIKNVLKQINRK